MTHPIAVPADVDDVAVMHEPIEERRRHDFIAEDVTPFGEALIRGEHGARPLVPFRHELEEEHRAGPRVGEIADLVNHEERRAGGNHVS